MIMGKSGCGKSTLERNLCSNTAMFKKIVSVTTRAQRDHEIDGQDYYFLNNEQFNSLQKDNKIIQYTEFAGNRYGSTEDQYTTNHPYATLVVVPYSAASFVPVLKERFIGINILNIYFDISDERLYQNMISRGDDIATIEDRIAKDDLHEQFKKYELVADYTITDNTLDEFTTERVLTWLQQKTSNDNG